MICNLTLTSVQFGTSEKNEQTNPFATSCSFKFNDNKDEGYLSGVEEGNFIE